MNPEPGLYIARFTFPSSRLGDRTVVEVCRAGESIALRELATLDGLHVRVEQGEIRQYLLSGFGAGLIAGFKLERKLDLQAALTTDVVGLKAELEIMRTAMADIAKHLNVDVPPDAINYLDAIVEAVERRKP